MYSQAARTQEFPRRGQGRWGNVSAWKRPGNDHGLPHEHPGTTRQHVNQDLGHIHRMKKLRVLLCRRRACKVRQDSEAQQRMTEMSPGTQMLPMASDLGLTQYRRVFQELLEAELAEAAEGAASTCRVIGVDAKSGNA